MPKLRILALTYRTFPVALSIVRGATLDALNRMSLRVFPGGSPDDGTGARILASGWRRELDVELEAQGPRSTRMRVLAKEGVFFGDNTANDLIAHVTRLLEQPSDAQIAGRPPRAADPVELFPSDTQVAVLSR